MACDGDIAKEEIEMVKSMCADNSLFSDMDVEGHINAWIRQINEQGARFLQSYLHELSSAELEDKDQLLLAALAIKTIEADNRVEYSEVKFFKKIRSRLSISDEAILAEHPDKEDFLLPDINIAEIPSWKDNIQFAQISINAAL